MKNESYKLPWQTKALLWFLSGAIFYFVCIDPLFYEQKHEICMSGHRIGKMYICDTVKIVWEKPILDSFKK